MLIHSYTFRADRLPEYVSNFDELLDIFLNEVGVDGIFTDFPDLVVSYLERNSANWLLELWLNLSILSLAMSDTKTERKKLP